MKNEQEDQRLHELLCAHILGETNDAERNEIERALAQSSELREERDRLETTIGFVRDAMAEGDALRPSAAAEILAAAKRRKSHRFARPLLALAASLAVIVSGYAMFRAFARSREPGLQFAKLSAPDAKRQLHGQGALGSLGYDTKAKEEGSLPSAADVPEMKDQVATRVEASGGQAGSTSAADSEPSVSVPKLEPRKAEAEVDSFEADTERIMRLANEHLSAAEMQAMSSKKSSEDTNSTEMAGTILEWGSVPSASRRQSSDRLSATSSSRDASAKASEQRFNVREYPDHTPYAPYAVLPKTEARARNDSSNSADSNGLSTGGLTGPSSPAAGSGGITAVDSRNRPSGPSTSVSRLKQLKALGYFGSATSPDDLVLDTDRLDDAREVLNKLRNYPPADRERCLDRFSREIFERCRPYPRERPRDMYFRFWGDNAFEITALDALSTFSVDVDTASYALARRYIEEGHLPEKAQVRTEEFINYFKADVPAPTEGTFAIHTDLTPSRFSADAGRSMLRVVIRGREVSKQERKPLALTFVIDVSGSMNEQNRLGMVKHTLRLLCSQLDARDSIAIVAFSTDARMILPMTSARNRELIESALEPLKAEGGTNSEAGLKMGYAAALAGLNSEATNRVVFLSDGVANVGETNPEKLSAEVKTIREKGVYLNTIGVGMNNHNDVLLEQLADKGDGMCNYIDSAAEAKHAIVDNFTGAFEPIARDVKVQVEFDPAQVFRYRLLGYENRAIADKDFRNDRIDAGELGAGHQVTALYEIERANQASEKPFATVRLRWKAPRVVGAAANDEATEIAQPVLASQATSFEGAGPGYRRAVIVAQFAEILRRSIHARGDSLDDLIAEAQKLAKESTDAEFSSFVRLLEKSRQLILASVPDCDELCRTVDAIRKNQVLRAEHEMLHGDGKLLEDIERQNAELEARIRDLLRKASEPK